MRAINVSGKITRIETPEYGRRVASERQLLKYDMLHMPKINANDYLFCRVRACSADVPNRNGDCFPYDELKAAYPSFIGCGVYTNHEADCVENMKGIILDAVFKEDAVHGAWVELLLAVAKYNEDLCQKIASGQITDVSMGCIVREGICSVCGNVCRGAKDEYGRVIDSCQHLERKGGDWNGQSVYEKCGGVEFVEISFVTDGADPQALVLDNNIVALNQLPEHVAAKLFETPGGQKRAASATKRGKLANTLVCELNTLQAEHVFDLCRHASPETYWDTYQTIQQYTLARAIRHLKDLTAKRSNAFDTMLNERQMAASEEYVITDSDEPDLKMFAQEYAQNYIASESDATNASNMLSYILGKYEESLNHMSTEPIILSDRNGVADGVCHDVLADLMVQYAIRTQPLSRKAAFKRIKNLADLRNNQTILVTDAEYGLKNAPASVHSTLSISRLSSASIDWVEVFVDQDTGYKLAKLYQADVDSGVTILHSV